MSHPSNPRKLPPEVLALFDGTDEKGALDRTDEKLPPALELHRDLQFQFDFLNDEIFFPLFGVRLRKVMFTLPRSRRFVGYFAYRTWGKNKAREDEVSEIAINPYFLGNSAEVLQALCHEMVHLAQAELGGAFGEPSDRGYHNKDFAGVMKTIGLMPSNIDDPERTTGYRMTDYVIEGGAFEAARKKYVELGVSISWATIEEHDDAKSQTEAQSEEEARRQARIAAAKRKNASKTKFICPVCRMNAWAKPTANLICGVCRVCMIAEPEKSPRFPRNAK